MTTLPIGPAAGTATAERSTAVTRIPIPERLVRMTRFGLDSARREDSGWWRRVQSELEAFVFAHVPSGAEDLVMDLDSERLEVVLTFRIRAPTPPSAWASSSDEEGTEAGSGRRNRSV